MWHQHLLPALFPQIILAAASVLCLLLIAWKRNHAVVHLFTLLSPDFWRLPHWAKYMMQHLWMACLL